MEVKLFVISDLHAFDGAVTKPARPSHYDTSLPTSAGDNPIHQLKQLISDQGIKADKLICCGDLADKAYPAALEKAWLEIQELKNLLGADDVIASVGNHDVDSRHTYNDYDARGVLLGLDPGFPFSNEVLNNEFWTHHFCVIESETPSIRYVVLNSSGFHGEKVEHEHGRVAERTVERLKKRLNKLGRKNINVLICHHHPQKMTELKLGEYDDMKGGDNLLRALDSVAFGPWLVIHGHKHYPKLTYAMGGSSSPVIFSAGSCAAIPYPEIAPSVGNQAYLVRIDSTRTNTSNCCGEFETWDWAPGRGWKSAQDRTGLPYRGGFGYRGDLGVLAGQIVQQFPNGGRWPEIESGIPDLKYLIPIDLSNVIRHLEDQHKCKVEISRLGIPILIELP